jgi:homoserine O-acetyltransferase/O-succinyltransferase
MHRRSHRLIFFTTLIAGLLTVASATAQDSRWPVESGDYIVKNFRFKSGETLPELKLHFLTMGTPHRGISGHVDNAILLLHGTGGSGSSFLTPHFADELYGSGQPFDITKFFLILPDSIGHGRSSKPSDGLRMRFPRYDYDDMVAAQHTLLTQALHVDHLRVVLGTSMGCMHAFVWGETYPQFMDTLVPMACLPVELAGRNRMNRYMAMQLIRADPAWKDGEYTSQPPAMRYLSLIGSTYTSVPLQMQKLAPTRAQADEIVDRRIAAYQPTTDANDYLYYTDSSRNYNPEPKLSKIIARVLWINSADDATNPAELGIAEKMAPHIPHARFVMIPISDQTRGHSSFNEARLWKSYLVELLSQGS